MKKLILYIGSVIFIAILISGVFSWVLNKGLKRSKVDFFGKMNAASAGDKFNLLLIGSSRTLVQIDPRVIDSATELHSFNFGLNGATIKTCYNMVQYGIQNQPGTKLVLVNIDYNMFDVQRDPYKDAFFYPYESTIPHLIRTNQGTGEWLHQIGLFDVALYDDMAKYAAIDGLVRPGRTLSGAYKGYISHPATDQFQEPSPSQVASRKAPYSEQDFQSLKDLIGFCKAHQVLPVLVLAPYASKYFPGNYIENYFTIINRVNALATESGIAFWDFSKDSIANKSEYFFNVNHLNAAGATAYSTELAHRINQLLAAQPNKLANK